MEKITPYFKNNYCTIYHGDCRDVIPHLGVQFADMVLADPPYGETSLKWDRRVDGWLPLAGKALKRLERSKKERKVDWLLSITSCLMLWLMGNKSVWGPRVGIVNQMLWIWYAISIDQFGLLVGVIAYTVIHVRNCMKWERTA